MEFSQSLTIYQVMCIMECSNQIYKIAEVIEVLRFLSRINILYYFNKKMILNSIQLQSVFTYLSFEKCFFILFIFFFKFFQTYFYVILVNQYYRMMIILQYPRITIAIVLLFICSADKMDPVNLLPHIFTLQIDGIIKPAEPIAQNPSNPWSSPVQLYKIYMAKTKHQFLPNNFPSTQIYAYGIEKHDGQIVYSFPGPTIVAFKDIQTEVIWVNNIEGKHILAIDTSPPFEIIGYCMKQVCTVVHLHGLQTDWRYDGQPMGYFTKTGEIGPDYFSLDDQKKNQARYQYPNTKQGLYWYHDHAMGITRLNVYAGLVGFYQIVDPFISSQQKVLLKYYGELERRYFALVDKSFNNDGSLYYPMQSDSSQFQYWVPEFFGDVFTVNGKLWPVVVLQQKVYRLVFLNGCQSRFLNIYFMHGEEKISFELFRRDADYLKRPLKIKQHLLLVGARIQIFLNLTGIEGQIIMMNNARSPYPMGDQVNEFTKNIMKIRIKNSNRLLMQKKTTNTLFSLIKSKFQLTINEQIKTEQFQIKPQQLKSQFEKKVYKNLEETKRFLQQTQGSVFSTNINVTNVPFPRFSSGRSYFPVLVQLMNGKDEVLGAMIDGVPLKKGCIGSVFRKDQTVDFYIINLTADDHPIHIHLVNFQIIGRFGFDVERYKKDWENLNEANGGVKKGGIENSPRYLDVKSYRTTVIEAPTQEQQMFLDVILAPTERVTIARIKLSNHKGQSFPFQIRGSQFVWHCHILEHEDNQMMRYFCIQ